MASIISAGTTSGTSLNLSGDTSGVLQLASNGTTTAVTIDTSQNVGIGTASPAQKLHVAGTIRATSGSATTSAVTVTQGYINGDISSSNFSIGNYGNSSSEMRIDTRGFTTFYTGATNNATGTEQARITSAGLLQFNSGYGSVATAYGCRAWVNFQGTDTVAIRASGNVSSVSDLETGTYQVNFTTAMPDTNYAVTGTCERNGNNSDNPLTSHRTRTTTSVVINTSRANTDMFDMLAPTAAIFR